MPPGACSTRDTTCVFKSEPTSGRSTHGPALGICAWSSPAPSAPRTVRTDLDSDVVIGVPLVCSVVRLKMVVRWDFLLPELEAWQDAAVFCLRRGPCVPRHPHVYWLQRIRNSHLAVVVRDPGPAHLLTEIHAHAVTVVLMVSVVVPVAVNVEGAAELERHIVVPELLRVPVVPSASPTIIQEPEPPKKAVKGARPVMAIRVLWSLPVVDPLRAVLERLEVVDFRLDAPVVARAELR